MAYFETFEYEIKFDYDNAPDRKFKKFITADSPEEFQKGLNFVIRKLFENGVVTSQNLRQITSTSKADGDTEKTSFGSIVYDLNTAKEKFVDFFTS